MGFLVRKPDSLIVPHPGRKVVKAADYAVWVEAERVLAEARADAQAILDKAGDAFEEERRRGFDEGTEEARMEAVEKMMETVGRSIDYFANVETKMVDLVMAALRKILADYDDRERVTQVVKHALSTVRNQKQVTLRLAPAQADMVRERINDLLAAYPAVGFLDITPDTRLTADSVIIESDIGSVEAGVEVQLEAIRRAFEKSLGRRHG